MVSAAELLLLSQALGGGERGGRGKQHKPEQCMDLQVENSFSKV